MPPESALGGESLIFAFGGRSEAEIGSGHRLRRTIYRKLASGPVVNHVRVTPRKY